MVSEEEETLQHQIKLVFLILLVISFSFLVCFWVFFKTKKLIRISHLLRSKFVILSFLHTNFSFQVCCYCPTYTIFNDPKGLSRSSTSFRSNSKLPLGFSLLFLRQITHKPVSKSETPAAFQPSALRINQNKKLLCLFFRQTSWAHTFNILFHPGAIYHPSKNQPYTEDKWRASTWPHGKFLNSPLPSAQGKKRRFIPWKNWCPNRPFRLEINDAFQEAKFEFSFPVTGSYLIHLCPWDPVVKTLPASADCTSSWAAPPSHHLTRFLFVSKPFPCLGTAFSVRCGVEGSREGRDEHLQFSSFNSPPSSQIPVSEAEVNAFNNTGVQKLLSLSTQQFKLTHFHL